ncbi:MAG: LPS export ABC transporter permease LptG [Deferrisomatales bacterium]
MKIVDRHLSGEFLRLFGFAVAAFLGLFLVVDFFEKLRMVLKYDAGAGDLALFFAGRLPWMAAQVIPMAALLSTLLSLVLLARHGEITALRAGGVSLRRLAVPYLACGLALSILGGLVQEVAAPRGFAFSREVQEVRIKGRPPSALLRSEDLWLRSGGRLLHVDRIAAGGSELVGVSVAEVEAGRLSRRVDAASARWEQGEWVLGEAEVRRFRPDGTFETERFGRLPYPLAGGGPEEFQISAFSPDEASWPELQRRIRRLRAQGLDTRDLEVGLWAKTSLPFAAAVMPLLAFPFGVRAGRRGGASLGIAVAVALGFAYWLVLAVGLSLGKAGVLPAPLAAWAGNALFTAAGAALLWRAEGAD